MKSFGFRPARQNCLTRERGGGGGVCVFQQLPCAIVVVQAKILECFACVYALARFYWKSLILERSERIIGSFKSSFFFAILSDCSSFILFFFKSLCELSAFSFRFFSYRSFLYLSFSLTKEKEKARAQQQQVLFSFNTSLRLIV